MALSEWVSRLTSLTSASENTTQLENGTELANVALQLHRSQQIDEDINNARHISSFPDFKALLTFSVVSVQSVPMLLQGNTSISTNSGIARSATTYATSNAYRE
jgi:hypothetical protein